MAPSNFKAEIWPHLAKIAKYGAEPNKSQQNAPILMLFYCTMLFLIVKINISLYLIVMSNILMFFYVSHIRKNMYI